MNPLHEIAVERLCDLCGAEIAAHARVVARGEQILLGERARLTTVMCRHCRFVFQPERPSDALLAALYRDDTSFAFESDPQDEARVRAGLAERQAVISAAIAGARIGAGASVLDLGGGRGECCAHLVPAYRVVVADTTEAPPVDARIDKLPGLFSPALGEQRFDVVVVNHVLEHVWSPTALLEQAHRALGPDGVLVAEVPFELYTPLVFRHLGDWRHVGYFCRATLGRFLHKTGFTPSRLALEMGAYGARRLPVIRAVARRRADAAPPAPPRRPTLPLLADMAAPVVLAWMARRLVAPR